MADHQDFTDLIDVSDVANAFEEVGAADEPELTTETHVLERKAAPIISGDRIASLKDRFAAFFIDALFMILLYLPAALFYRKIAFETAFGPIPAWGMHGMLFHGLFFTLMLLAASLFEFALGATPGKLLTGLRVTTRSGESIGFGRAFLRNLFRPFDVLLNFFYIGFLLIDKTRYHQRLGDLVANTIVVSKRGFHRSTIIPPSSTVSASANAAAFVIDFLLVGLFCLGYTLLLSPAAIIASFTLTILAPVAILLFVALPPVLTGTTPGHFALGTALVKDDGSPIDVTSSLIRAIFLPMDALPFGFISIFSSSKRQKIGDAASGIITVLQKRDWKGAVSSAVIFLLTLGTFALGKENRQNLFSRDFRMNFLPSMAVTSDRPLSFAQALEFNFGIEEFRFAAGDETQTRRPPTFHPGETIFLAFQVVGYRTDGDEAWLKEDLLVRYPDDSIALTMENILEFRKELPKRGAIEMVNNIALPANAAPGRYSVVIGIRDIHGNRKLKEQRFFYVTAREPAPEQIEPETPAPTPAPVAPPSPPPQPDMHQDFSAPRPPSLPQAIPAPAPRYEPNPNANPAIELDEENAY